MSRLLACFTYPGGSEAFLRHALYIEIWDADRYVAVVTTDGACAVPPRWDTWANGRDQYLNGSNLCRRLVDTIAWCAQQPEDHYILCEYDCLGFKRLPDFDGVMCDRTGGRTWNSKASWFGHWPICMDRESAVQLMAIGYQLLLDEPPAYNTPDSSPDVFFGLMCDRARIQPEHDRFRLFTRNKLDIPGDLELAQAARRSGVHAIHGVKSEHEFRIILS